MHKNLADAHDNIVAELGRLAPLFNFSDMAVRLYGALLLSPEPASLDELADRLNISKGAVSKHMQALEHWGMVQVVWLRGRRKKYFKAESDLWQIACNVLISREQREVEQTLRVLGANIKEIRAIKEDLPAEEKETAAFYLERVGELQVFFLAAQAFLSAFIKDNSEIG